jgi:NAD-dependent dihydropyrimidine dehydrogenase PreA subunit
MPEGDLDRGKRSHHSGLRLLVAEIEAMTATDLWEKMSMKKQKNSRAMKRRDFLKASAVAGAAKAAVSFEAASGILHGAEGKKVYVMPNVTTPNRPVIRNPEACIGCNTCVDVCQVDVYIPNPVKGKPPITLHPDECWYCGCCVNECPRLSAGAIKFNFRYSRECISNAKLRASFSGSNVKTPDGKWRSRPSSSLPPLRALPTKGPKLDCHFPYPYALLKETALSRYKAAQGVSEHHRNHQRRGR